MSEQTTHQTLEGMAAEYASAIECRRALEGVLRGEMLALIEHLGPALREATGAERDCRAALESAVAGAPALFIKPKTRSVHGVQYGWRTGKARIEVPDEAKSIRLIREKLDPAQHPLLILTKESVYKPAVLDLTAKDLRLIGVRQLAAEDSVICKATTSTTDKLVETLLAEVSHAD